MTAYFLHQNRRHHLQDTTYEKKRKSVFFFYRPKNREDSSDFDDFWTKIIAATRPIFWKFFERTKKRTNERKNRRNERKSHRPGRRYRRWCLRSSWHCSHIMVYFAHLLLYKESEENLKKIHFSFRFPTTWVYSRDFSFPTLFSYSFFFWFSRSCVCLKESICSKNNQNVLLLPQQSPLVVINKLN